MNVALKCDNQDCPVGTVSVYPKDGGEGSDMDEINGVLSEGGDGMQCPLCSEELFSDA